METQLEEARVIAQIRDKISQFSIFNQDQGIFKGPTAKVSSN